MTLEDFVSDLKQDVDTFEKYWAIQSWKNRGAFPMSLENLGEWYEQFLSFLNTTRGEE